MADKTDKSDKRLLAKVHRFIEPYRITNAKGFKLSEIDPGDTGPFTNERKAEAKELTAKSTEWLAAQQEMLYAQDRWALLLIFQAMDAAGKDSTIKHVMSGLNPQGTQVYAFKTPTSEELDHDWMWRYQRCLPERGRIGVFNRSYYEEVLIVRVHEEILGTQKMPKELITKNIWDHRLQDIANTEEYLARNGVKVLKFFLHVSKKEQKRRFMERLELPEKHWKFDGSDVKERNYWNEYTKAYEAAIRATATRESPWHVVPADNKWFTRLVVAATIVDAMKRLDLHYPKVDKLKLKELELARKVLEKSD